METTTTTNEPTQTEGDAMKDEPRSLTPAILTARPVDRMRCGRSHAEIVRREIQDIIDAPRGYVTEDGEWRNPVAAMAYARKHGLVSPDEQGAELKSHMLKETGQ